MAPLDDLAAVDVPSQIEEHVAGRNILPQHRAEVFGRDPLPDEADALVGPRFQRLGAVLEVQHRDVFQRHAEVLQQDRQRTLGNSPIAYHENPLAEVDHAMLPTTVALQRRDRVAEGAMPTLVVGMRSLSCARTCPRRAWACHPDPTRNTVILPAIAAAVKIRPPWKTLDW